jgi:prolipoprotein diacylglyceryltransferase
MAIGRIGCFLTGNSDHTYGNATTLFTGVDFGDGVRRHPTQLYESAFLIVLALGLAMTWSRFPRDGDRFKTFMIAYLAFRLVIDFLKPEHVVLGGLSLIQLSCLAGLAYYAPHARRLWRALRAPNVAPAA